jgi:hypothetical protein
VHRSSVYIIQCCCARTRLQMQMQPTLPRTSQAIARLIKGAPLRMPHTHINNQERDVATCSHVMIPLGLPHINRAVHNLGHILTKKRGN